MKKWYSSGNGNIPCCNCSYELKNYLDHHPQQCPSCNVKCAIISLVRNRDIQIIPERAPSTIKRWIYWCQLELDELEFLELMDHLGEIFGCNDDLSKVKQSQNIT